jgi:hypothetical protein
MFKATEVEVCRAYGAKFVIYEHRLGVHHTMLVKEDFDAGAHTLSEI